MANEGWKISDYQAESRIQGALQVNETSQAAIVNARNTAAAQTTLRDVELEVVSVAGRLSGPCSSDCCRPSSCSACRQQSSKLKRISRSACASALGVSQGRTRSSRCR